MPYYPALPDYKPVAISPGAALVGGLGRYQALERAALENAAIQEGLDRKRREAQALREYQQTGDVNTLIPALEPREAALIKWGVMKQQIETGEKMIEFLDANKKLLTLDMYPEFYRRSVEQFGDLAKNALRPPGSFKDAADFEKYVWDVSNRNAQLKASVEMAKDWSRIEAAKIAAKARIEAANIAAGSRAQVAEIRASSQEKTADKKPQTISQARLDLFREGVRSGRYPAGPEGWKMFLNDEAAAKQSPATKANIEARTNLTNEQARAIKQGQELLKAFTDNPQSEAPPQSAAPPQSGAPAVRPPKPNKSPYELFNKRTNTWQTLTKEQYEYLTGIKQ